MKTYERTNKCWQLFLKKLKDIMDESCFHNNLTLNFVWNFILFLVLIELIILWRRCASVDTCDGMYDNKWVSIEVKKANNENKERILIEESHDIFQDFLDFKILTNRHIKQLKWKMSKYNWIIGFWLLLE
jgi:hypothetical protein